MGPTPQSVYEECAVASPGTCSVTRDAPYPPPIPPEVTRREGRDCWGGGWGWDRVHYWSK